jgi:hypothetical protein
VKQVWLKSYGSLAFQWLGVGVAPFSSPTTLTIGNITNQYVFNSTGFVVESLAHPSSMKNEPVPLISVESTTLLTGPLQATSLSLKLVNNGAGENATVYVYPTAGQPMQGEGKTVGAGESIGYVFNSSELSLSIPKVGDHVSLEISAYLCYGNNECFAYQNFVATTVTAEHGSTAPPTIEGASSGTVWLVGAASSGLGENEGVRSRIEVVNVQATGSLAFWVSDGMPNQLWGQVGYFLSGGAPPVGFYQVWNLTSDTLVASGTTPVSTGNHTFEMYLQKGTTWAYAIDGSVFGTYDMGATSSSGTFPVYVMSEEQGGSVFSFPSVGFSPVLEILEQAIGPPGTGSWAPAQSASVYGTGWGVEGSLQNSNLGVNQIIVGGNSSEVPQGTALWGS